MKFIKPNKNLTEGQIKIFLGLLHKVPVKKWESITSHQYFYRNGKMKVWVKSNGLVQVDNVTLCESIEFFKSIRTRINKREAQLRYLRNKKQEDENKKTLQVIRNIK